MHADLLFKPDLRKADLKKIIKINYSIDYIPNFNLSFVNSQLKSLKNEIDDIYKIFKTNLNKLCNNYDVIFIDNPGKTKADFTHVDISNIKSLDYGIIPSSSSLGVKDLEGYLGQVYTNGKIGHNIKKNFHILIGSNINKNINDQFN